MQNSTESAATESTVAVMIDAAVSRLEWDAEFFDSLLDPLSDDQMLTRAGGVGNHPLWAMGHIAWTNDFILSMITGTEKALPAVFDECFAGGTQPSDDPSAYPSRDDVRAALVDTRRRVFEWTRSLTPETAFAPPPEVLQPFAPNAIQIPFSIVAHDLFHLGQVATVRACLGLEPIHR